MDRDTDMGMDINLVAEGQLYEKDRRRLFVGCTVLYCTVEREKSCMYGEINQQSPPERSTTGKIYSACDCMQCSIYHILSSRTFFTLILYISAHTHGPAPYIIQH